MKKIIFSISFLVILLTSCKTRKYPWGLTQYSGVVEDCNVDSLSFGNANVIRLNGTKKKVNINCPNKPDFYAMYPDFYPWPMTALLVFKNNEIIYTYNPRKNNKGVALSVDAGKLNYDKKTNTLTITSNRFEWTGSYNIKYIAKDSILILTKINK